MTLPVLTASAWREYRGKLNVRTYHADTSHLATIADASGKLHHCYVKLLPPHESPALACEAISWVLANNAGVPSPAFAAIVLVPLEPLTRYVTLPGSYANMKFCPAWCSEIVEGHNLTQIWQWEALVGMSKCLMHSDTRKIAAFDVWADLQDRNTGNVVRSKSGGYMAIDNETAFHGVMWPKWNTRFELRSLLGLAHGKLNQKDIDGFKVEMADASDVHDQALASSLLEIERLMRALYPAEASFVADVVTPLTARAAKGWLATELGVIA